MGQLRNKCVLEMPPNTNYTEWVQDEAHWFMVNDNPELCGNSSGARCVAERSVVRQGGRRSVRHGGRNL